MILSFFRCAKPDNSTYRAGNHQFFVRADDAHGDPAGVVGNHRGILRITRLVELNAEKAKPFADAGANGRAVLPDAGGENQRIQSTERGGEGADPFFRLITK